MPKTPTEVTHLLQEWSDGDRDALDKLIPLVVDEVRDLARKALASESRSHTWQPTELVHEAYLRLVDRKIYWWKDRGQFFACLADLMRKLLVDHARRRNAAKRGSGELRLSLDEGVFQAKEPDLDLVLLDDALKDLEAIDQRRSQIVKLRIFTGLTQKEIAREMGLSVNTVGRQWQAAKLWLRHQIQSTGAEA